MAPYVPDEVNVFNVPHSRMKELVNSYFTLVRSTNFSSVVDMSMMLEVLYKTFSEFKTHEQIENKLIMKKLRHKMRLLAAQNAAVCNCHKGSKLREMMHLVRDGFNKNTVQDCINYGIKLKKELDEFTSSFLPHMQEEEEVFQPLLLEYFTYEELCQLKQAVIQQHLIKSQSHQQEAEKFTWSDGESATILSCDSDEESNVTKSVTIDYLPTEMILSIFSLLSLQDLCRCSQVSKTWRHFARNKRLWTNILPLQWSQGRWSMQCVDVNNGDHVSVSSDPMEHEACILKGLDQYVLPALGSFVQKLILKGSHILDDTQLDSMLNLCGNIRHLDVSYCNISDKGLQSLQIHSLTTLVLSGCVNITDEFLRHCFTRSIKDTLLVGNRCNDCRDITRCCRGGELCGARRGCLDMDVLDAMIRMKSVDIKTPRRRRSILQDLILSGCWQITDASLIAMSETCLFTNLRHIDMSGCFQLTSTGLRALVTVCPVLDPTSLYYCDNIVDGPYSTVASGCRNLECQLRVCCRLGD